MNLGQRPKIYGMMSDDQGMWMGDDIILLLMLGGGAAAAGVLLCAIGSGSHVQAQRLIDLRREKEREQKQMNAAAEAAGLAAATEPLALNADGTISEPILGLVENR